MSRCLRTVAVLLGAFGLLAQGCGDDESTRIGLEGSSEIGPEPAAREFDRPISWESVLLEDLGHSATLVFTGGKDENLEDNPCAGEYDVEVEETSESITITLYSLRLVDPPDLPEDYSCTSEGYARRFGLTIGGDGLEGRTLIDGSNGQIRPVIDETAILQPARLPDGWSEWNRYPRDGAMIFDYGPEGGSGFPPLMYLAAPTDNNFYHMDRENLEWPATTLEEIGVRGNTNGAFVITSLEDGARTIVFEEGGRHHRVTIQAGVPDAIGFDFVESLN